MISQVKLWLFESQGSTRPLALFRIALVLLLWARFAEDLALWQTAGLVEILIGLAFFTSSTFALIGWQTRASVGVLTITMALVIFHLGFGLGHVPFQHHHTYLLFICTALCAAGPCDRSLSLDRWLRGVRGEPADEIGNLLANRLLVLQLAAIYFWTAFDKSNAVFLSGIRLDQILHFHYHESLLGPLVTWLPLVIGASVTVVLVEYYLAWAVISRRWLKLTLILGLLVHGSFYLILPVQTFSLTMLALYLFVLPETSVHRAVSEVVDGSPNHE